MRIMYECVDTRISKAVAFAVVCGMFSLHTLQPGVEANYKTMTVDNIPLVVLSGALISRYRHVFVALTFLFLSLLIYLYIFTSLITVYKAY